LVSLSANASVHFIFQWFYVSFLTILCLQIIGVSLLGEISSIYHIIHMCADLSKLVEGVFMVLPPRK
ncbi:hypothetical protein A4A49_52601, partial [Nicotiana attenuata]